MSEGTLKKLLDDERNAHHVTTLKLEIALKLGDLALEIQDSLLAKQELDEMEAAVTYATATARIAELERS